MEKIDIAVIGGGSAGLSAALAARENGAKTVVVFERSLSLGGVLRQCIHNGFGIHHFGEDLTGTQYAKKLIDQIKATDIVCKTGTNVLDLTDHHLISVMSPEEGYQQYEARAVILATGCRERPRGALLIPGSRPAGVITAGTAQRYMNLEGYLVGKRIVILGSGDIGLIMARQFILEGAEVKAVVELLPYSAGLMRNIVQCINDFDIPLYFNTTVTRIVGEKRVEGVYLAEVDDNKVPILSTERYVECDTLMLSVGLIPESELAYTAGITISPVTGGPSVDDSLQTSLDGVFACGNTLHVHDLVDFVSQESKRAGENAALYLSGHKLPRGRKVSVVEGPGIRGIVPQHIYLDGENDTITLQFRPDNRYYNKRVAAYSGKVRIAQKRYSILTPGELCEIQVKRSSLNATLQVQLE